MWDLSAKELHMHRRETYPSSREDVHRVLPPSGREAEKAPSARPTLLRYTLPEAPVTVREIMARNPLCASPDATLDDLARMLVDQPSSGIPVVDGDRRPMGMVSKSDLLHATWQNAANPSRTGASFHGKNSKASAKDLMTAVVFCLPQDATISQAAALMAFEEAHQIPIVDEAGRAVGLVSALDIMRWIARREGYLIP
jgi:CBS domain-containing protein